MHAVRLSVAHAAGGWFTSGSPEERAQCSAQSATCFRLAKSYVARERSLAGSSLGDRS